MNQEKVHFRLIVCPSCNHQLCWVNPRLPTFCPECRESLAVPLRTLKGDNIIVSDENAWLKWTL